MPGQQSLDKKILYVAVIFWSILIDLMYRLVRVIACLDNLGDAFDLFAFIRVAQSGTLIFRFFLKLQVNDF